MPPEDCLEVGSRHSSSPVSAAEAREEAEAEAEDEVTPGEEESPPSKEVGKEKEDCRHFLHLLEMMLKGCRWTATPTTRMPGL